MVDSKSKEDKCKVTNVRNLPNVQFVWFKQMKFRREIYCICLIKYVNIKWIRQVLLKIRSGHHSVHRRTDGQGETSIPYFQIRWSGGIVILHISSNTPLRVPYYQVWYKNGNRIFRSCRVMRILRDTEYHLQHSVSIYHLLSNTILS